MKADVWNHDWRKHYQADVFGSVVAVTIYLPAWQVSQLRIHQAKKAEKTVAMKVALTLASAHPLFKPDYR